MTYKSLSESLRPTADAARDFFKRDWGVHSFRVEEPIDANISYCPTLSATTRDQYVLCIEVSGSAYHSGLDQLVIDCRNYGMPAKVFVAIPKESGDPQYRQNVRRATACGVGLVEISGTKGRIIHNALSLSLTGCRPIDKTQYPAKYRGALSDAEHTFREGDPAKACAAIYDEIEALCRRVAKRTLKKGCWTKSVSSGAVIKMNLDKAAWQNVVQAIAKHCDARKCGCPKLDDTLCARVLGIVPYRNEVGHKPKSVTELLKRDAKLRTRFESGADILFELISAAAPLHV